MFTTTINSRRRLVAVNLAGNATKRGCNNSSISVGGRDGGDDGECFRSAYKLSSGYALKWLFFVLCLKCCCFTNVGGTTSAPMGLAPASATHPVAPNCSAVVHIFEARGIHPTEVRREPMNDMVLRYCELPATGTCCTYNMETRLAGTSRQQLEKNTKESIGKLSTILGTRAQKFNGTPSQINVQDMINRNLGSENGGRSTQLSNIEANIESDRGVDFRNPNSSFLNQSAVLTNKEVSQNRIEPQTDDVSNETVVADHIFAVNIETLDSIMNVMTDFFRDLLAESKKEFHAMFKRTYGVIYEQNAYVFSDLFTELENYYARGKVDLAEAMDSFFNTLYQKMFTVLNSQYSFDDKYLGCVSEHMKELKPFGDVPDKLSVQIKRSFVATRTYAQALNTAADVAKNMINVRPNADCTAALTKMQQCSACKGFPEKPCSNYCVNVMKGCLQYYNELDNEWDNFVASMERVSERLLGPFNIVMVVEPINIKISEAIMNFQETGHDVSNTVFQGCGRPVLGRRKRSISPKFVETKQLNTLLETTNDNYNNNNINNSNDDDSETLDIDASIDGEEILIDRHRRTAEPTRELQYEPVQFSNSDEQAGQRGGGRRKNKNKQSQGNKKNSEEDEVIKEPVLDKLVKDIRQKVKDSKKFWSNLPYQICNNEDVAAPPGTDIHCWNGNTIDRYTHPIASDQTANPEFPAVTSIARQSSAVASQLFYLRTAVSHLRNAYNGIDVVWSDQEEPYYGSGSGSGGGNDDDDEESSGIGPYQDVKTNIHENPDIPSVRGNPGSGGIITTNTTGTKHHHNKPGNGRGDDETSPKASGATPSSRTTNMSLRRALLTYLFPIYMAWFGGIISDLL